MTSQGTAAIVRAYYEAWTGGDFARAAALLAPGLAVEVPVNEYPDAGSFAAALKSFGSLATRAELLAAMSAGQEGMLLYDMDVPGLGTLRVAEHLTVDDGQITRIGRSTTPPPCVRPASSATSPARPADMPGAWSSTRPASACSRPSPPWTALVTGGPRT